MNFFLIKIIFQIITICVTKIGTRHVDPDTGIIYFKYDFGYEFGIIFPGEGKKIVGGIRNGNQHTEKSLCPRNGDIEVPVTHEKSNGRQSTVSFGATTPIEFETDKTKKRYSLPTANYYDRMTPKSGIFQTSGTIASIRYFAMASVLFFVEITHNLLTQTFVKT